MACTIKYNKKGKIETVLTPQGKESQLFKQIAKLPHVNNLEEALDIFKNSYSKRFSSELLDMNDEDVINNLLEKGVIEQTEC